MRKRLGPPISKTVEIEYYMRHTTVGVVKGGASLGLDESSSHLNPDVRVTRLLFEFDKDVKLRDALGAIAELRSVCATGCEIVGQVERPTNSARVTAMPHNEAEKEFAKKLALADMHFHLGGTASARAAAAERAIFTIRVDYRDAPQEFNFETTPVSRLTLALSDPVQDKEFDKTAEAKIVALPVYKPL